MSSGNQRWSFSHIAHVRSPSNTCCQGWLLTHHRRSGRPPKDVTHHDAQWLSKVTWQSADLFDPRSYQHHLKDASTVVHSVGILLENQNYKTAINSNSSVLSDFVNFIKPSNPLTKTPEHSYTAINRDSALLLCETFIENTESKDPTFVYISADKGFPGLPSGYITSKREAELELALLKVRSIFARPGFMFDEESQSDNIRSMIHKFVDTVDWGNKSLLGGRISVLNEFVRPTISTQRVANAIIRKVEDPHFSGILGLDEMLRK